MNPPAEANLDPFVDDGHRDGACIIEESSGSAVIRLCERASGLEGGTFLVRNENKKGRLEL